MNLKYIYIYINFIFLRIYSIFKKKKKKKKKPYHSKLGSYLLCAPIYFKHHLYAYVKKIIKNHQSWCVQIYIYKISSLDFGVYQQFLFLYEFTYLFYILNTIPQNFYLHCWKILFISYASSSSLKNLLIVSLILYNILIVYHSFPRANLPFQLSHQIWTKLVNI